MIQSNVKKSNYDQKTIYPSLIGDPSMSENSEKGIKWWIRFVVVPLIVAFIGGGGLYIFVQLPNLVSTNHKGEQKLPEGELKELEVLTSQIKERESKLGQLIKQEAQIIESIETSESPSREEQLHTQIRELHKEIKEQSGQRFEAIERAIALALSYEARSTEERKILIKYIRELMGSLEKEKRAILSDPDSPGEQLVAELGINSKLEQLNAKERHLKSQI